MTGIQEGRDVSNPIRDAIIEYELQLLRCPKSANPTVLERYRDAAVAQLEATDMGEEAVHDAFAIYLILRDNDARANMLKSYLSMTLSLEEEAWARWNLCDALAMARMYEELVATHNAFLEWAQHNLDKDKLFWVMEDGTQALGWFAGGYGDEWMQVFHELNDMIPASKHNRFHRFRHHRSACNALARFDRPDETLAIADKMLAISCEDTSWKYSFYVEIAAYAALIGAYNCIDTEQLLKTAEVAKRRMDGFAQSLPKPDALGEIRPPLPEQIHPADCLGRYSEDAPQIDPVHSFRGACHSLGAVLYRARQYELAIPLFEMAMAYQFMSKYLARCYAASVWVVTRDRERILSFVNEVAPMFRDNRDWWKSIPELKDLANAPSLSG